MKAGRSPAPRTATAPRVFPPHPLVRSHLGTPHKALYHLALAEFMKGNPEPAKRLWSHRDDISLANPQGSAALGRDEVSEAMERAASTRRDGKFVGYETVAKYVSAELAYVVEVERLEAKVHGGEEITPYALRVTMIFRPEEGV
jgi:hypothetical protein